MAFPKTIPGHEDDGLWVQVKDVLRSANEETMTANEWTMGNAPNEREIAVL